MDTVCAVFGSHQPISGSGSSAVDEPPSDPAVALDSLHALLLAAPAVGTFLQEVADLAALLVEPPASVGITAHHGREPVTVASSDDRAQLVDAEQYTVGDGPCLEAMRTGRVVEVEDQRVDPRWDGYAPRARRQGVKSSLSLPLSIDTRSIGALNLYSHDRVGAFGGNVLQQAERFAERASVALALTIRFNEQVSTSHQLEEALASRTLIDQAIGILMAEQRCTAHEAFDLLRRHSQSQNRRLRQVAEELITRVSGAPPAPSHPFEHGTSD
jgi:GAF domain-containing protein